MNMRILPANWLVLTKTAVYRLVSLFTFKLLVEVKASSFAQC